MLYMYNIEAWSHWGTWFVQSIVVVGLRQDLKRVTLEEIVLDSLYNLENASELHALVSLHFFCHFCPFIRVYYV